MRQLFALLLAVAYCIQAPASQAKTLKERMAECLSQIKAAEPDAAKHRGWLGACKVDVEVKILQSDSAAEATRRVPLFPRMGSGAECTRPLPYEPVANTSACGKGGNFVSTFDEGVVRLPLADGRCIYMLPLLVTDKDKGFYCNAVRSYVACVRPDVRHENGKTIVTLAAKHSGPTNIAEVTIPENPETAGPLVVRNSGEPLFALLPSRLCTSGEDHSIVNFIADEIDEQATKCRLKNGAERCREQRAYHAERMAQEVLRRAWNPFRRLAPAERKSDKDSFVKFVKQTITHLDDSEAKALASVIITNEIGDFSPYQVLDAVLASSGPSWGAHQIDIGANAQSEIDLFWMAIKHNRPDPGNATLKKALAFEACLSAPIRNYATANLALFYDALDPINASLRTVEGRDVYNKRFERWLREETDRAKNLKGLFGQSRFARLYYLDVNNQFGPAKARRLKSIGESLSAAQLASCSGVRSGEARLIAEVLKTGYKLKDIKRRSDNIHDYLRNEFGPSEDVPSCP